MTSHKRITAIFDGRKPDRHGFWLGNPSNETKRIYYQDLGIEVATDINGRTDTILKTGRRTELDILLHRVLLIPAIQFEIGVKLFILYHKYH